MKRSIASLLLVFALAACSADDPSDGAEAAGSTDATTEDATTADATGGVDTTDGDDDAGIPPLDTATPDAGPVGPITRLTVIDDLVFTTADGDIAPGFDLDGVVSDGSSETTCYSIDYVSPEGVEGIDNKLAGLVPFFEAFGIGAAQGLIKDAIETGGILLMLQLSDIDDLQNDDEITVTLRAGSGVPLLGTDGKLLPGQTFSIHEDTPDSMGTGRIVDGRIEAGPLEVSIPIVVFGIRYDLTFLDTRLEATWTEDGGLALGMLGGAIRIAELITIGEVAAQDDPSVLAAIEGLLGSAGDLEPDDEGVCQKLSGTFLFTAVSGFLYPGEE